MIKYLVKFFSLFTVFLIVGCASSALGPIKEENFAKVVSESVNKTDGEIIFYNLGWVHLDRKGFVNSSLVRTSSLPPDLIGILVVTNKNIMLQQWHFEQLIYKNVWKLPIDEIASASLVKYGLNLRIAFKKKDNSYDSISVSADGGNFISTDGTLKVFSLLPDNLKLK